MRKNFTESQKKEAVKMYCEDKMSLQEVANEFGVTRECVRLWINKLGRQTREYTKSSLLEKRNSAYYDDKSLEKAKSLTVDMYKSGSSIREIYPHIKVKNKDGKYKHPSRTLMSKWIKESGITVTRNLDKQNESVVQEPKHSKELRSEMFTLVEKEEAIKMYSAYDMSIEEIADKMDNLYNKRPSYKTVQVWLLDGGVYEK